MESKPDRGRSAAAYWIILASALYATLGLSALCFRLNPSGPYWRAWEYFTDIVYRNGEVPPVWERPERGDLSRRNFIFYQQSHLTRVSTDQDGFRSTPSLPGPYRVAVLGDSTIFGSGLSDEETLPWRLSQKLGVKVFNGARQNVSLVLGRQDLGQVKLVIEGRTERAIVHALSKEEPPRRDYRPLRQGRLGLLDCAPLQLYFFPSIADRIIGRLGNDLQDYLYYRGRVGGRRLEYEKARHTYAPRDLAAAVAGARQRQAAVASLGYAYVLLPVPSAQTFYAADVEDFTRSFIPRLCRELQKEGVACVDVATVLAGHKDEGLWQNADTHWNGRATELAAEELAAYLRGRGRAP